MIWGTFVFLFANFIGVQDYSISNERILKNVFMGART